VGQKLQFEEWVPVTIDKVFLFFANPQNLPRIMPPATGTRLTELHLVPPVLPVGAPGIGYLAGVGSLIVTSFRIIPFLRLRASWTARIVEFEWNHHFADIQQEGPFKSFHHRHEFVSENRSGVQGTIVRDAIEYDVGYGWIGSRIGQFFVAGMLRRTFAHRQKALPGLLITT
jgi:ligand-binding SRPBCC domain-containing protein